MTAARLTIGNSTDLFDVAVAPRLTPTRAPLVDQRGIVLPPEQNDIALADGDADFPAGPQAGVRWNHIGRLEYSASVFRGFNHLPWYTGTLQTAPFRVDVVRHYSRGRARVRVIS